MKRTIPLGRYSTPAIGLAVVFTSLMLSFQARAVTVLDPSFENASVSGGLVYAPTDGSGITGSSWIFSYPSGIDASNSFFSGSPPDGVQAGFIQTGSSVAGGISQSLTGFTVGQSYDVTFWIARRPFYLADPINVTLGGTDLGTYTPSSTDFTQVTTSAMVVDSTSLTLLFSGAASVSDIGSAIDLVSVSNTAIAAPEPASGLLLCAGAVLLGRVRRFKGRAVQAIAELKSAMVTA